MSKPKKSETPVAAATTCSASSIRHWERGYRCHGFWEGNRRLGRVSLGSPIFWKAGRDPYLWETDVAPKSEGSAPTLQAAKFAVEKSLPNVKSADAGAVEGMKNEIEKLMPVDLPRFVRPLLNYENYRIPTL